MNYDEKYQLLIIGDSTVGKTSILCRYTDNIFNENYLATVGIDFFTKDEIFNENTIRVKIWDTAGQERYQSLSQSYYRNAQGIMIVFDVTNLDTFNHLIFWINSIKSHITDEKNLIPMIIIGNKIDADEREVEKEEAKKFAECEKIDYFETSAKTGEGVENSIKFLIQKVMKNNKNKNTEYYKQNSIKISIRDSIKKDKEQEQFKIKCCK